MVAVGHSPRLLLVIGRVHLAHEVLRRLILGGDLRRHIQPLRPPAVLDDLLEVELQSVLHRARELLV